jgi:DNA-directed RNA polymerase specialized sigma subunit
MSQARTIQTKSNPVNLPTPVRILKDLFDYYKSREYRLVQLAYKKGANQTEVADALEVDQALVSRNYPRGGKK